jgi:hypothetical protein
MTTAVVPVAGVAAARNVTRDLCAALGLPLIAEARPGADLSVRARRGLPFPPPGRLLRAADGWVHPGPPTVWDTFSAMAISLGAPVPATPGALPDLRSLPAETVDAEAGEWRLPAVAVRGPGAVPQPMCMPGGPIAISGATVLVLGTAWAAPLTGLVLARLGASVARIENPRREDPFPLGDALASGQTRLSLDLDDPAGRDAFVALLERADLLVDGNTPRVLGNLGLDDAALNSLNPRLSVVRLAAFASEDRPGYGLAAECRGGWVARLHPPRLARTSVADPVAGLLAALAAVDALARPGARERVSLEGAVGHLLVGAMPGGRSSGRSGG